MELVSRKTRRHAAININANGTRMAEAGARGIHVNKYTHIRKSDMHTSIHTYMHTCTHAQTWIQGDGTHKSNRHTK